MSLKICPAAVLIILLTIMACKPIDVNDEHETEVVDPSVPGVEESESFLFIDGEKYPIKCAGYYHNTVNSGYDFVFSNVELNLTKPVDILPANATVLYVDVPDCDMNTTSQLKYIMNGDDWEFYFGFAVNGMPVKLGDSFDFRRSVIKSGTMRIVLDSGELLLEFDAVLNHGNTVKCQYKGKPQISNGYLYNWNS